MHLQLAMRRVFSRTSYVPDTFAVNVTVAAPAESTVANNAYGGEPLCTFCSHASVCAMELLLMATVSAAAAASRSTGLSKASFNHTDACNGVPAETCSTSAKEMQAFIL
jgi:hypothetical protein